jgi:lipopolysaccharide biosynthesis glycosyltransferase
VSIASLLDKNSKNDIHIYLVDMGISSRHLQYIWDILDAAQKNTLARIQMTLIPKSKYEKQVLALGLQGWKGSNALHYKFFIFNEIKTSNNFLLWLDADSLILGDLSALFQPHSLTSASKQYPFGATWNRPPYIRIYERFNVKSQTASFSPNFLLVDLDIYRNQNYLKLIQNFICKYISEYPLLVDEIILNIIAKDNVMMLKQRYNMPNWVFLNNMKILIRFYPKLTRNNRKIIYQKFAQQEIQSTKIVSCYGNYGFGCEYFDLKHNLAPFAKKWHEYYNQTSFRDEPREKVAITLSWTIYKIFPKTIVTLATLIKYYWAFRKPHD